jgi:hypothetical protein
MTLALSLTVVGELSPTTDFDICAKASGDVAVAACNRAIASSIGRDLATLYHNRGVVYL